MSTLQSQMDLNPRLKPQGLPQGLPQGSTPGLKPGVESPRNVQGVEIRPIAHTGDLTAQEGTQRIRVVRRQDLHYLLNRAKAAIEQALYYRLPCVRPNLDGADLWLGWRLVPEGEGWFPIVRDGRQVTPWELVEQLIGEGWVMVEGDGCQPK